MTSINHIEQMRRASVIAILKRAKTVIEPKGAWTRGASARDAEHFAVPALSERAVCWCATGALAKASHQLGTYGYLNEAIRAVQKVIPEEFKSYLTPVAKMNDKTRDKRKVLRYFDAAIKRLEAIAPQEKVEVPQ